MDISSWIYLSFLAVFLLLGLAFLRRLPLLLAAASAVPFLFSLFSDLYFLEAGLFVLLAAGAVLSSRFLLGKKETSLEAMVGRSCTVTERIAPLTGGQVRLGDSLWAARGLSPEAAYEEGAVLTVVAIEGVKLICR